MTDRRSLTREYKETPREAGVYQIRNKSNGKIFVGAALDVPGKLNGQRFQLQINSHRNAALQRDWQALGPDAFAFEILDRLEPIDAPGYDPADDLRTLEELWLEKLQPFGDNGYNTPGRRI